MMYEYDHGDCDELKPKHNLILLKLLITFFEFGT